MWTALILLNLGALHCTVSSSPPSPINVIFSSVNLRNMLQWLPGNGTPDETHFTVQYAIYGDSVEGSKGRRVHWRAVRQCTEIVRSWCDLSNETWDLEQGYHARVRAVSSRVSSKWATTRRFDPKSDTSFGPPLVSVEIENNSAIITLKGPMRYQPNNHTPVVSMATFYPQMMYNISIHNTHSGQTSHFPVSSSLYKHRLMDYATEYCFSAKTKFLSMPVQCQSSARHCITTPPDPVIRQLQSVVVGIVVPSACMCMLAVVGYLLYHYLSGKGQKSPYILDLPSFKPPPLTFPPENLNLMLITVIKPSDIESSKSVPACPKRHIADAPSGYAPQRSETPPEPEEPWEDVSIDYGFVGVAPQMDVRGEGGERERRHNGGDDGNNIKGEHQKCIARDSYVKKEWTVEAGVYAPHLSQKSTHTCSQTNMPMHTQTERSTLVQAHAFSQVNSVPLTQAQVPLLSFQGATEGEVDREKEDREFPGLFINSTPQTGPFRIPFNLETKEKGGVGEEMDGEVRVRADGKIDGGVEEGSENERVSLLSAYASQKIKDMSTSHADQSDFLPDDCGVSWWTWGDIDNDDEEEEEEEEGAICIDWDPMTRKLVLPEMAMEFTKERGLDGLMQGEKGRETRVGGEEEEAYVMKGELTLENVYVRQASEEEAEAQREMEGGGEIGSGADDILNKWDLVVSMDV